MRGCGRLSRARRTVDDRDGLAVELGAADLPGVNDLVVVLCIVDVLLRSEGEGTKCAGGTKDFRARVLAGELCVSHTASLLIIIARTERKEPRRTRVAAHLDVPLLSQARRDELDRLPENHDLVRQVVLDDGRLALDSLSCRQRLEDEERFHPRPEQGRS